MLVQLTINDFPKSRNTYYFEDVSLIGVIFNLTAFNLDEETLKVLQNIRQNYTNAQISIKFVSAKQGMRVCKYAGRDNKNNIVIKWENI
jgi:hypothetical protein